MLPLQVAKDLQRLFHYPDTFGRERPEGLPSRQPRQGNRKRDTIPAAALLLYKDGRVLLTKKRAEARRMLLCSCTLQNLTSALTPHCLHLCGLRAKNSPNSDSVCDVSRAARYTFV